MQQIPYSPDLAPSNIFLFSKLKINLWQANLAEVKRTIFRNESTLCVCVCSVGVIKTDNFYQKQVRYFLNCLIDYNSILTRLTLFYVKGLGNRVHYTFIFICLNFWDEDWWFLPIRVFRIFSSSLLFTTFRPICPPTFFRCFFLSNSGIWNHVLNLIHEGRLLWFL